jgi:polyhydroxyalkanoate synthesis regulator phasin
VELTEDLNILWKASQEIEESYCQEVEKNKHLVSEVQRLGKIIQTLETRWVTEKESHRFQARIQELESQVEKIQTDNVKLQTLYPIRDLLSAKQMELDRLQKSLQLMPPDHADREPAEAILEFHRQECDELQCLWANVQLRFQVQNHRVGELKGELSQAASLTDCALQVPEF